MCNARAALLAVAVVGVVAAIPTGGASLAATGAATGGGAAAAAGTSYAAYAGIASAAVSAGAAYQAQKQQEAVAKANGKLAENKAQEDQRQGELNAQKINEQAGQLQGTQRATMAARGLDLGAGTPADIIAATSFFGQNDAATARYNGKMAAWGDRQQGAQFNAEAAGYGQAAGLSLLAGAGSVASKWYNRSSYGGG